MMAKIIFNGQEYDSPEAMPAEVRQLYQMAAGLLADRDQNGVPDIFEGGEAAPTTVVQSTQFIVDGKVYTSLDELPAEARQKYEQAGIQQHGTVPSTTADQPRPTYLPITLSRGGASIKVAFLSFS